MVTYKGIIEQVELKKAISPLSRYGESHSVTFDVYLNVKMDMDVENNIKIYFDTPRSASCSESVVPGAAVFTVFKTSDWISKQDALPHPESAGKVIGELPIPTVKIGDTIFIAGRIKRETSRYKILNYVKLLKLESCSDAESKEKETRLKKEEMREKEINQMKLQLERNFNITEFASFDAEQTWEQTAEKQVEFQIQSETPKAFKVIMTVTEDGFEDKKSFYLPKSQVEKNKSNLSIPEWLAKKQSWEMRLILGLYQCQINEKITVE